jgi:putative membrane protein
MKKLTVIVMSTIVYTLTLVSPVFAQQKSTLTDPEIASVAVVANQNDIGFAEIAKKKSKNADVLKFAETMATDHKTIIDLAVALVTKLKVTPKDNSVSQKLMSDAKKTDMMLNSKMAKEFDKAYVDNEVGYHKAVISEVEDVLIPQSQNLELKDLLKKALGILKTHLEHAEMLQKMISK